MANTTRYTGKLVSSHRSSGTGFSIQAGRYSSNNGVPGFSFSFASDNEATRKYYRAGNPISEDFPHTVDFFNFALYEQLQGKEGATISWEINRALVPVNVQIEGVEQVLCPA